MHGRNEGEAINNVQKGVKELYKRDLWTAFMIKN